MNSFSKTWMEPSLEESTFYWTVFMTRGYFSSVLLHTVSCMYKYESLRNTSFVLLSNQLFSTQTI